MRTHRRSSRCDRRSVDFEHPIKVQVDSPSTHVAATRDQPCLAHDDHEFYDPTVEMLEFLDRLAASINSSLPDGFRVEPNRRPDLQTLHDASNVEAEEVRRALSTLVGEPGGFTSILTEQVELVPGQTSPLARQVVDEPDLFFLAPLDARQASGSYLYGYFDQKSPWGESSDEDERLLEAALHVLDDLQDSICEGAREPWPNKGIAPVPSPRGEIVGRELRLWFEDVRGVAQTLPSVPLD